MANSPQFWQREYNRKGIPSSFLEKPSGIVELLYKYLKENQLSLVGKIAADLGCGKGRNSFSLIDHGVNKVYALDFVPKLINEIRLKAKSTGVENKVIAICHDLTKPWPIPSNSLDLILDVFCFKHQTTFTKKSFYKKEIVRTLKPGGLLLIDLADVNDGYYGSLPKKQVAKGLYKIIDPVTGVDSLLYTKESLVKEFQENFYLLRSLKQKKFGLIHGKKYNRITLKSLFKKK